jgi:hypothetical protein
MHHLSEVIVITVSLRVPDKHPRDPLVNPDLWVRSMLRRDILADMVWTVLFTLLLISVMLNNHPPYSNIVHGLHHLTQN